MNFPEWIITTETNSTPHKVEFRDLFKIKNEVTSALIIWPLCSYYVNVKDLYFIIRGGQRTMLPGMDEMVDPKFYYAKRHKEEYTLQGDGISHTNYIDSEKHSIDVIIQAGGCNGYKR